MQISHKYKFIFFSFPKTGSESVRRLLDPYSDIHGVPFWKRITKNPFFSHISPIETMAIFNEYGWNYDDYYKFTFVRNPWARMVSLYNMIYQVSSNHKVKDKIRRIIYRIPSFNDWLISTSPSGEGAGGPANQRWQVYGAYSIKNYILDESGNELVNDVIKLEEINNQLPITLKQIGIPQSENIYIPFINKGKKTGEYKDYYNDSSRELIYLRYAYDIERFGYKYDDNI